MDFYQICTRESKNGIPELYPDFTVGRSKDLMVRGKSFYAIWDEEMGLWSTDEYDVIRLVDADLYNFAKKAKDESGISYNVKYLRSAASGSWYAFRKYLQNVSDNSHELDANLTFMNTEVKKSDYRSRRLPYPLEKGACPAWDELVGTLYSVEERAKIEWAIGAIVSGDAKKIQKFLVLYGPAGTGKSTILNIVQSLFDGYSTSFEAKALGSNNGAFATEVFKHNPLVAIQHDGDLSKIEDNTRLNSIISHEEMTMNEKYKPSYTARVNAFLWMGTNQPVRISDAKSGIIRRLIDVSPTNVKIPANHYHTLMSQIDFELGAIAAHCQEVYRSMGKNFYNAYRPLEMMFQTDVFFNFIEAYFDVFSNQDGCTLSQAYGLYKEFCNDTGIDRMLPQYKVREELRNYFEHFADRATVDGAHVRSYYSGFTANKFKTPTKEANTFALVIEETSSLFDDEFAFQPAQYGNEAETPKRKWEYVKSTLETIDTSKLHFVKVPEHHIVIDFDLKNDDGEKSLERNLEAASAWPPTYAELSKGGAGVHLHYHYDGDVHELASLYSEGIEVKTLLGDASLRRRLSKCNNIPIATINSGLPLKEKKMLQASTMSSEKSLRDLIARNLRKEINPGTKSSVDFIKKILDDAYEQGMEYDVSDLRPRVMAFANNSSNQALAALKVVMQMKWASDDLDRENHAVIMDLRDERLVIFDVEVYPNLFIICWKYRGDPHVTRMRNPTAAQVEELLKYKLVGFYNRRYDNHIIYAASLGYTIPELYRLSQKIVNNSPNAMFGEAYNLSYADVWDICSIKMTLKKWEIELGLHHMEMDIPWDEPVPEDRIEDVEEYCCNDVIATEAVLDEREQDMVAREILAELSGLTINDTTQKHTGRILFGNDKNPAAVFNYVHLEKEFPGYVYDHGKSWYREEEVGEGGYVYAEPGMYSDVALLDVASMHPTSIMQLELFGEYTPRFGELLDARLAIKRRDFDSARLMLNGKLAAFLKNEDDAKALSDALKIVINTVYGLTAAKFENLFKDPRNKDNIVAKRGALFMIDLKHFVQERGFTVAHIKTDSIKIPNATPEIIHEVQMFGEKYGYTFEHEATYERFCLVNDAVYVARKAGQKWEAVGAQFQHPYVYKELFSHEDITWDDLCETKAVQKGVMYLDFGADQPMWKKDPGMLHVGKIGRFIPVVEGNGGGVLWRIVDDKKFAVSGTKGYFWLESELAQDKTLEPKVEIDMSYFERLADNARDTINKFGDFNEFVK